MVAAKTLMEKLVALDLGHRGQLLVVEGPGSARQDSKSELRRLACALREFVGPSGTLVVPTCTSGEGRPKPTFDPANSPSEMGAFSEYFRKLPGVVRSHSPTHSVAALGPLTDELVSGHRSAGGRDTPWGEGAFGKGSPWDLLYEKNAAWVMIDTTWERSPFCIYLQALYAERHRGITKQTPFPWFDAKMVGRKLEVLGLVRQMKSENHTIRAFELQPTIDAALEAADTDPTQFEPSEEFKGWLSRVEYIKTHGYLQAGVARAEITPQVPCRRWDGKRMTGVHRDLFARAVVLSHGSERVALVLCDLLGISGALVQAIKKRVGTEIGLPPGAIQIACTHSHSTPDTIGLGYADPDYLEFVVETVSRAICDAAAAQQAVRMGWSRVPIRGIARSRRKKMTDGTVFTTRYSVPSTWRVDPSLVLGEGVIDPDVTVIRLEDLDGQVLAAVSNFGCHASVALMSPNISGDFPGEAMVVLESVFGGSSVALCTNGAAADVDPTLEMPYWGPRRDEMARHLGRILAAQVLEALERTEVRDIATVGSVSEQIDLEARTEWMQLLESQKGRVLQEFMEGWSLESTTRETLEDGLVQTEIQALRLDDLILLGLPGEVFAEFSLGLKSEVDSPALAVVELANDDIGYIAPPEKFEEGGYEVEQHLWSRITPAGTMAVREAALRLVYQLADI